jgi:hypothetical protein
MSADITWDERIPDSALILCAGCDRDVIPHTLVACDACGNDVCCGSVQTLAEGPKTLCRKCNDGLGMCDHCAEYSLRLEETVSRDDSVGYSATEWLCANCRPKRRVA